MGGVTLIITMFVDDGAFTTRGCLSKVEHLHSWLTRLVLNWVRTILRKTVARNKLTCITGSNHLKATLAKKLEDTGCRVTTSGEMLGVDYAAGGKMNSRPIQRQRAAKAKKRKGRLRWWRGIGGNSTAVVKQGALPAMGYGSAATGITTSLMRDMRKMQGGFTGVRAAGASLTAKLALAGERGGDLDPAIILHNPPLEAILAKLWEDTRSRSQLVKTWLRAKEEFTDDEENTRWRRSKGPVHAAMLQLIAVGAEWHKPFHLRLLDKEIPVLEVPPKQIIAVLKAHTRRYLDHVLLEKLSVTHGWDKNAVMSKYKNGINWKLLRDTIFSNDKQVTDAESHALKIVSCGGYWPAERRWLAGMRGMGTCEFCCQDIGSMKHELFQCSAQAANIAAQRWAGRLKRPRGIDMPELAPLFEAALPPKCSGWEPIEVEYVEGSLTQGHQQETFGDGSGYRQEDREASISTWSVVRLNKDADGEWQPSETLRGNITGWFSTVPRAEMRALVEHLRHAGPGATYVGDCKVVIDAMRHGVQHSWTSWRNINADIWRTIKQLLDDHGTAMGAVKIKSHRGRGTIADEEDDRQWIGNALADKWAKELGKTMRDDQAEKDRRQTEQGYQDTLKHIAVSAAWMLKRRPPEMRGKPPRQRRPDLTATAHGHSITTRRGGGWECAICRRLAISRTGLRALKGSRCEGVPGGRGAIHETHRMGLTKGVHWCMRCGSYTVRWPRELRNACKGAPGSEAQANVRRRLAMGLAPTTATYLEGTEKLTSNGGRNSATTNTHRGAHASCGRYLRLPGGPLEFTRPRASSSPPKPAAHAAHDDVYDDALLDEHGERHGDVQGDDFMVHDRVDGGDGHNYGNAIADVRPPAAEVEGKTAAYSGEPRQKPKETQLDEELAAGGRTAVGTTLGQALPETQAAEAPEQNVLHMKELDIPLQSSTTLPRRRIRGKTPLAAILRQPTCSQDPWPPKNAWSARVRTSTNIKPSDCNSCSAKTRLICHTCSRSLCYTCARARVRCSLIRAGMS